MNIEYEATFCPVDIDEMRTKLGKVGAKLTRKEFDQKRVIMHLPTGHEIAGGFVRVRNEGDKITMTMKIIPDNAKIEDQKEWEITVSDYDTAIDILKNLGCNPKAYEETRRERWDLDNTDITLDTWPFLGTIIEIEGKNEADVKAAAAKLGFDWKDARFCTAGTLYKEKYGYGPADLHTKTGKVTQLVFNGPNPFI